MDGPEDNHLQQMLQSAVQAIQWTYSLFWQICPQQGILIWGDGYYNGAIKTRKTIQSMEVSTEEASFQRSQQLKELYESLSAGDANQPTPRPCAALSPEDLTESEWFYLMCVSFSFPPGVGLPGKAFSKRRYIWLTGANEVDSRIFSRAILAKSAQIQTVVCIPLMDGVVELGNTERVEEDLELIQRVKSFFNGYHQHLKPAISEHSTSNPKTSLELPSFQSPRFPAAYFSPDTSMNANPVNEEDDDDEEDEEDEEEANSDSEAEAAGSLPTAAQGPERLCEPITRGADLVPNIEPSELMQVDMSEDIRVGSPDDGSTNLESDLHMLVVSEPTTSTDHQWQDDSFRAESTQKWPLLQSHLSKGFHFQQPSSGATGLDDLTQEDTHYSQTVSAILRQQSLRWSESLPISYIENSPPTAFSKWCGYGSDQLLHLPSEGTSQWLLKNSLLSVPYLYTKHRDQNSPKSRDGEAAIRVRKGTQQDDQVLSANHVLAERRRREKLNERFIILRSLVPFVTKMDKASILGDTIEYLKQLRRKIQELESQIEIRQMESDVRATPDNVTAKERQSGAPVQPRSEKKKLRAIAANSSATTKAIDPSLILETSVQVSIIECDALVELQCSHREGLLLDVMHVLRDLRLETTTVQSSLKDGTFVAELRAKVKENENRKKATIVEVKRAIHSIIPKH